MTHRSLAGPRKGKKSQGREGRIRTRSVVEFSSSATPKAKRSDKKRKLLAVNLDVNNISTFLHRRQDPLLALHDPALPPRLVLTYHSTVPETVS